jgi:hypothetical protein
MVRVQPATGHRECLLTLVTDAMVAQNLTRVPISAQYSQLSRREYTAKIAWAEVVLPRVYQCARGTDGRCVRLIQADTRELTIVGENFGSRPTDVKILLRPTGGCEVTQVTATTIVCKIFGALASGQPLRAGAFRTNVPEVVSYWISFIRPAQKLCSPW